MIDLLWFILADTRRYPYAIAAVSLACKGPIVVRSVFKMLQDQPFFKVRVSDPNTWLIWLLDPDVMRQPLHIV